MKKILVRHEPVLFYIELFGLIWLFCIYHYLFENHDYVPFVIVSFIEVVLLIFHFIFREEIIAIISDEGIDIPDGGLIKWEDIKSWDYSSAGKCRRNMLEIHSESGQFSIKGFSYLKVINIFKRMAPGKQRTNEFVIWVIGLIIVGILSYLKYWK